MVTLDTKRKTVQHLSGGIVKEVLVQEGQQVKEGQALLRLDGAVAKANELVSPQTFGGTRGPSTSLLAVADLNDLQVEVDVSEEALAKIGIGQKCKVSPEAYPELQFDGRVAEIAPEANRAKGTLQIKVQVERPDRHLTPELSAKVDFLP